jgi:predicted metal-dependent hydrolase
LDEIGRRGVGWSTNFLRYHGLISRVQLDLPFLRAPAVEPGRSVLSVEFVRMRRARRYIVRVRPDGTVRVTIPRGGSRAEAARFLNRQLGWIAKERQRVAAVLVTPVWADGASMMLRGQLVPIRLRAGSDGRTTVCYGERSVRLAADGNVHRSIQADLRTLARDELGERLHLLAGVHQMRVSAFTVRNQRSRWGSCSRAGRIALNYRLIQMPPSVSDYVILHELMHLKEQNHSRRFWRLVEHVCPGFREAERWLRKHGPGLL